MQSLTPRQIVAELDKHIVGQHDAKRAVAVAVRNRWRRQQLPDDLRKDVSPKNILMIGPTGVGKTEIARRLATLVSAPFVKVEATKFTEVGYHGRDVDAMIRDLLDAAIAMVRVELQEQVKADAMTAVEDRLIDLLVPHVNLPQQDDEDATARRMRTREKVRAQIKAGEMEERLVEITVEDRPTAMGVLGPAGMGMDVEFQSMVERMMPTKRETRRLPVKDARQILLNQEAEKLIDKDRVTRTAIERTEQTGIVFLDEIDKIATGDGGGKHGPDVSRQGVQRDLLPIVEGSTVATKFGPVKTDHILFIAAGAFHAAKPSDLMPELQGRFPIRVELQDLTKDDFVRILKEPQNSLTHQAAALLATEAIEIEFDDSGIDAVAQIAYDLNRTTQNIGARRLYTILERVFEDVSFQGPDLADKTVRVTAAYVRERLAPVLKDEDLSKFIL